MRVRGHRSETLKSYKESLMACLLLHTEMHCCDSKLRIFVCLSANTVKSMKIWTAGCLIQD